MQQNLKISNGVMLNAYPDSIGEKFSDTIAMLKMAGFKNVFSFIYVLPTFFNSDLDRGFSIIDYDINKDLVNPKDLKDLNELQIKLKFDIVLNHLSVASPQFKDLLQFGNESKFKDFFINSSSGDLMPSRTSSRNPASTISRSSATPPLLLSSIFSPASGVPFFVRRR